MSLNGGDGLDQLLQQELQRAAGNLEGPTPLAGQSAYHAAFTAGGSAVSLFSSITAAVTTKAAIAATAATLVVGGAAAGTVATGSPNPANWGSAVVAAVQGCKTTAGTGSDSAKTASTARDNVGQCVSAFAKQHGAAERAEHSKASEARTKHAEDKSADKKDKGGKDKHGKPDTTGKPDAADQPEAADLPEAADKPDTAGKPEDGRDGSHPTGPPTAKPQH